ncbi:MAG: electron transport complex subunit E [Clostridia bacterium]|nr:electron transport complex subunit E [Clostridia bacterium]
MNNLKKVFLNGVITENPTFRLVLGMCPTLAVTTQAVNGLGMGLAATFVLVFSNLVVSLLRKQIPDKIRIPAFILIIATFVTIVDLLMHAYLQSLYEALGIFIPLIVVNCIIFARAETFAFKNPPLASVIDGLGMGIGFTVALTIVAAIREILGSGTIFGIALFGAAFEPALMFVLAPGGFLTLGVVMALVNTLTKKLSEKKEVNG